MTVEGADDTVSVEVDVNAGRFPAVACGFMETDFDSENTRYIIKKSDSIFEEYQGSNVLQDIDFVGNDSYFMTGDIKPSKRSPSLDVLIEYDGLYDECSSDNYDNIMSFKHSGTYSGEICSPGRASDDSNDIPTSSKGEIYKDLLLSSNRYGRRERNNTSSSHSSCGKDQSFKFLGGEYRKPSRMFDNFNEDTIVVESDEQIHNSGLDNMDSMYMPQPRLSDGINLLFVFKWAIFVSTVTFEFGFLLPVFWAYQKKAHINYIGMETFLLIFGFALIFMLVDISIAYRTKNIEHRFSKNITTIAQLMPAKRDSLFFRLKKRAYRWTYCKRCQALVFARDHHCEWLNICINSNNYLRFFILLMVAVVSLSLVCVTTFVFFKIAMLDQKGLFSIMYEVYNIRTETGRMVFIVAGSVALFYVSIVSSLILVMVLLLFVFHVYLAFIRRTTAEFCTGT